MKEFKMSHYDLKAIMELLLGYFEMYDKVTSEKEKSMVLSQIRLKIEAILNR